MIDPNRVEEIFLDCLFKNEEEIKTPVYVEGITVKVGFHPDRLESHKKEIFQMLEDLPKEFMEDGGGGWSFLNACMDKDGRQWTGLHKRMEELFMLGMALNKVVCQLPREVWPVLPGGMPYYVVLTDLPSIKFETVQNKNAK